MVSPISVWHAKVNYLYIHNIFIVTPYTSVSQPVGHCGLFSGPRACDLLINYCIIKLQMFASIVTIILMISIPIFGSILGTFIFHPLQPEASEQGGLGGLWPPHFFTETILVLWPIGRLTPPFFINEATGPPTYYELRRH